MFNVYVQVHEEICKTKQGESQHPLQRYQLIFVSTTVVFEQVYYFWCVKVGANTKAVTDIMFSKIEVLHTSIACAYGRQICNMIFHDIYDTLKRIELHHHNVYSANKTYNSKWDFSEFSSENLQKFI